MRLCLYIFLFMSTYPAFSQVSSIDLVNSHNRVITSFESFDICEAERIKYPNLGGTKCLERNQEILVTGLVRETFFEYLASSAEKLKENCLADMPNLRNGAVYEVYFSVNNNDFIHKGHRRRFKDYQLCSFLHHAALQAKKKTIQPLSIMGYLNRTPFYFRADDRPSLLKNCITTLSTLGKGDTEEITYSLNGAAFKRITNTFFWLSSASACQAMIMDLDSDLQ
jgi:hypothetical protein